MRKRIMRSFVLVALALVLVFSTTVAYAAPAKNKVDVQIERFGTNKIQVVEDGKVSIIEVAQVSDTITEVRVYGPDNDTLILTVDQNRQTITSSQTGESVKISDVVETEEFQSTRYTSKTKTVKIPYSTIKKLIYGAITIAHIAAAIVAFISGSVIDGIIHLLEAISNIVALVTTPKSGHGLKVTLKSYQKTVHHGHESAVVEYWKATKIAKY